jgi:transketolase
MTASALDAAARSTMANAIRALSMDAVQKANSGHPGLPMGAADVVTALFSGAIKYDASAPSWPDRDRFVLSAGHGSMLLYALLHLLGVPGVSMEDLKNFRQIGSKTPGHPEYGHTPGVETTTGPLGQGIATAVGMALAERMLAAEFGDAIVDHKTYVLASDGDLMEGVSQEAIAIAGHLKLSKMIVLWDDNGISIDGPLSVADSVDQLQRFASAGWATTRVDGHDQSAVLAAIEAAQFSDKPTLIACKTIIGFGAPTRAGKSKAHGEPLGADEIKGAREALGWPHEPFVVPADVAANWASAGRSGARARADWEKRLAALPADVRAEFERRVKGDLPKNLDQVVAQARAKLVAEAPEMATRKSSEAAIKVLAPAVPELVTGSADLTGSNNTKVEATPAISPGNFKGRFVHWGIREHGMAAALNGMALHGGYIPSGATFLVFTDYCRPSIRLAALMGVRVIHVMTHDSIGLGEDGPTHQPVEHLASLRCMPNVLTLRPCDAVEALECWQMALENATGPSVMALTRQNLPTLRKADQGANLSAKGAYEISPAQGEAVVTLFATGSEVAIAVEAQKALAAQGVPARVVSVPSIERFLAQDDAYKAKVIGTAKVKIAVEAAVRMGWDAIIGSDGGFVGMSSFGASGPYKKLYEQFGITPDAVAALARDMLKRG